MPSFDNNILIQNIKNLMKENGVSQTQLAKILCSNQSSVSKCLSGDKVISLESAYLIAQHFKVSIDDLCCDHSLEASTTVEKVTSPKSDSPAQILISVCTALATIFKTSTLRTNEFERRETVYIEETDEYGNELGRFYQKHDQFNMDPVNKYISVYFPNYEKIQNDLASQSEANEYFCLLQEYGNTLEINVRINEFLGQLTDLQSIYLKNSMSTELYYKAIDDNLEALKKLWNKS